MNHLTIKSYAKINLSLSIKNKRSDGYHNIESIMQTIKLHDKIKLKKSKKITCKTNVKNIPNDEQNLAIKAAKIFFNFANLSCGVSIKINKKIPQEAGLGGGSSNAAFVLIGLNKLFKTNFKKETLLKLAAKIGADVPFLIVGGTAFAKGIGEIVEKIKPLKKCHILIIKPNFSVSTKEAYSKFDKIENFQQTSNKKLLNAIENEKTLKETAKLFFNDFEKILNLQTIFSLKEKMLKKGALCCNLTGSGSCVFAIFDNKKTAKKAKKFISKQKILNFLTEPKN